jgi:hypothetical protein
MNYKDMTDKQLIELYSQLIGPVYDYDDTPHLVQELRTCLSRPTLADAIKYLDVLGWGCPEDCARVLWRNAKFGPDDPHFYKTTITYVVLSEEPIPDEYSLEEIVRNAVTGEYSAMMEDIKVDMITEQELAIECANQGTDPEFFLGDRGR